MNRSLYTKLVLIILLLIVSLMAVVGAFLIRGVQDFYLERFYMQMYSVFSTDTELARVLRASASERDAPYRLADILRTYSGPLGIDTGTRNYYVLSGDTGAFLEGSDPEGGASLAMTPNILMAIRGEYGNEPDSTAEYMDVALPIAGENGESYIIYVKDNKQTVQSLNQQLFGIIFAALGVGLIISALLSLLLAKTMVTPIQSLTRAAERVASGDFSNKLENDATDEIGVLTRTFNDMAGQLEETMENLRKSEEMRREFVANVSHELRTPITSIRSYAETISDAGGLPEDTQREFLQVIVNESDRMTKIVQDLLTLSRFDAGSFEFYFEEFSFEKSLRDVYNATNIEAMLRGHKFTLEFKNELPPIRGDRLRVEQVLINMISNAVKYTRNGGRIRITAGRDGDYVWAQVRDNGLGIPERDVSKVFERFYRVDKARSRDSGGTGLGLSIAKEIILRHDGKIELKSAQGKGTLISVKLPIGGPSGD